jgi:hypothetical protein
MFKRCYAAIIAAAWAQLTHQPPDQDTSGDQRPRLPETGDEFQVG